jgi:hypothetical protein
MLHLTSASLIACKITADAVNIPVMDLAFATGLLSQRQAFATGLLSQGKHIRCEESPWGLKECRPEDSLHKKND